MSTTIFIIICIVLTFVTAGILLAKARKEMARELWGLEDLADTFPCTTDGERLVRNASKIETSLLAGKRPGNG